MRAWPVLLLFASVSAVAGADVYRLEERKTIDPTSPRDLRKVLVVGISDDREIRNRFEDKFVTHLRGRGKTAEGSHTLVPSLTEPGDRDRMLAMIEGTGVDSVMTVRAVDLDEIGEEGWAGAWRTWTESASPTVRELVEKTLPIPKKKAKRYGIEFALWDLQSKHLLWSARTGVCTRKQLKAGVADLLQLVIDDLKEARWL